MPKISRRSILRAMPCAASLPAALPRPARAQAPGKLKITKFALYKASLRWRSLLFLEIHTDGGLVGIGEGTCHGRVEVTEAAIRWLEPHMVGLDPAGTEDHWDRMYYRLTRWRTGPMLMTALAAVDMALWDLEGKRLGLPVWRLLGGPIHKTLRAYYTHWNGTSTSQRVEDYGRRAAETVEKGWTAVKWAVPRGEEGPRIEETVARMAAIRKAVGSKLDVGLELYESFSPRSALRLAQAVAPYQPMFLEEPVQREMPQAFTGLAAKSPVPIATGEGLLSRYEFKQLLDAQGAAIIQPDVVKCGGITEMRKIANMAEAYGVEVAPHMCYGPVGHVASLQTVSVCRNFLIHEWEAEDDALFQEVTGGAYPVQKNGRLSLPPGPGLGISMDFADFSRRFPFNPKMG